MFPLLSVGMDVLEELGGVEWLLLLLGEDDVAESEDDAWVRPTPRPTPKAMPRISIATRSTSKMQSMPFRRRCRFVFGKCGSTCFRSLSWNAASWGIDSVEIAGGRCLKNITTQIIQLVISLSGFVFPCPSFPRGQIERNGRQNSRVSSVRHGHRGLAKVTEK